MPVNVSLTASVPRFDQRFSTALWLASFPGIMPVNTLYRFRHRHLTDSSNHLIKLLPAKTAFFCRSDQRVLDAALDSGQMLPYSCRGGNCGRCAARILSGDYRYDRDTPAPGLTAEHRSQGMALLCQVVPEGAMTVEVAQTREAGSAPVLKLPCRIVERVHVAPNVMKLELQLPRTQPMAFAPGQYLDVLLDRGRRRSYSFAGAAAGSVGVSRLELHVRRVEGGAFSAIAFDPKASSLLRVEGPLGTFGWRDTAAPSLMIAGGTGFAPLKSMLLSIIKQDSHAPVHLFWGARSEADVYERELCEQWAQSRDWFSFTPVVRGADVEAKGEGERFFERALHTYSDLSDWTIYSSGPPGLVSGVIDWCKRNGIAAERVVTDSFDHAFE